MSFRSTLGKCVDLLPHTCLYMKKKLSCKIYVSCLNRIKSQYYTFGEVNWGVSIVPLNGMKKATIFCFVVSLVVKTISLVDVFFHIMFEGCNLIVEIWHHFKIKQSLWKRWFLRYLNIIYQVCFQCLHTFGIWKL